MEFETFIDSEENYDYVFNLSALKHVRSEKDPYTIMRMIMVNIFNTLKSIKLLKNKRVKKYFCVSTDKAANPVNLMGATKKIMEMFLMRESYNLNISTARFANVAFSDGSLLHGFNQRFLNRQPISAPNDVRRYFITPKEAGELCVISAILGKNKDIFFPKVDKLHAALKFSDIAINFLKNRGFGVFECKTENEAREIITDKIKNGLWPCYFFNSDTSGEKDIEEFYTSKEKLDFKTFKNIGVIENQIDFELNALTSFENKILEMRHSKSWNKIELIKLFNDILPEFSHKETGKNLDQKM